MKLQSVASRRMTKIDQERVKRLSTAVCAHRRSIEPGTESPSLRTAINRIADKRMAQRCHVYAYLMSPTGCKPAFEQRGGRPKRTDRPVIGDRQLPAALDDRHLRAVAERSPNP